MYDYDIKTLIKKFSENTNFNKNGYNGLDYCDEIVRKDYTQFLDVIESKNPTLNDYMNLRSICTKRLKQTKALLQFNKPEHNKYYHQVSKGFTELINALMEKELNILMKETDNNMLESLILN